MTINGKCGDLVNWTLVIEEGSLVIYGKDAMYDYTNDVDVPWNAHKEFIRSIKIVPGVTHIGKKAFIGCEDLITISIPDTVDTVGEDALAGCTALTIYFICEGWWDEVMSQLPTTAGVRIFVKPINSDEYLEAIQSDDVDIATVTDAKLNLVGISVKSLDVIAGGAVIDDGNNIYY